MAPGGGITSRGRGRSSSRGRGIQKTVSKENTRTTSETHNKSRTDQMNQDDDITYRPIDNMPPRRRGRSRGLSNRKRNTSPNKNYLSVNTIPSDQTRDASGQMSTPIEPTNLSGGPRRGRRGRGRPSRGRGSGRGTTRPASPAVVMMDESTSQVDQTRNNSSPVRQSNRPRRSRATVINLDVTYSSDDLEEDSDIDGDLDNSPKQSGQTSDPNYISSFSPDKSGDLKGTSLYYSDSDDSSNPIVIKKPIRKPDSYDSHSDSDVDLFAVNYGDVREKAFLDVSLNANLTPEKLAQARKNEGDITDKEVVIKNDTTADTIDDLDSSLFDTSLIKDMNRRRSPRNELKRNKQTTNALKKFKKVSDKKDHVLNLSKNDELTVLSDVDDSDEMTIRVHWEHSHIQLTVNNTDKFAVVYQKLAHKYGVSINDIVLSLDDCIINPESRPVDLQITIADVLEGGIQSYNKTNVFNSDKSHNTQSTSNPNCIMLKFQNSNRKDTVVVEVNKYDRMSVVMEKYARERNLSLKKVMFRLDGELLDPQETAVSLDLEGGECVDVFLK